MESSYLQERDQTLNEVHFLDKTVTINRIYRTIQFRPQESVLKMWKTLSHALQWTPKIYTDTIPKGVITNLSPKAHLFVKHYRLFAQKRWLSKVDDKDEISPLKHAKCREKTDSSCLRMRTWIQSFLQISLPYSSVPRIVTKSTKW